MKGQILFSAKNKKKKVINFSSAKLALGIEVVNFVLSPRGGGGWGGGT